MLSLRSLRLRFLSIATVCEALCKGPVYGNICALIYCSVVRSSVVMCGYLFPDRGEFSSSSSDEVSDTEAEYGPRLAARSVLEDCPFRPASFIAAF